jgi:DNA-binding Lrp family transcriptional regulator
MTELKPTDYQIIAELTKNPRLSDRQLAKILRISQPTVTRRRTNLEKEGLLEYRGSFNLEKLGFGIIAVVFGKRDYVKYPESLFQKAIDFNKRHPNMIFAAPGFGLGYNMMSISIHKDYPDYARFIADMKREAGEAMQVDSFLIDLHDKEVVQHLSLNRLAEYLNPHPLSSGT